MGRLNGKIALITGAGGGIGSALCARFLAEGAAVVAADINYDAARATIGNAGHPDRTKAVACDVGDSAAVRSAIAHTTDTFGSVNVLVNVAGGSSGNDGPVTEASEDEFWRAIRVDLFGTFLVCKHGIPEVIKAGGGTVINFASVVALQGNEGLDCYTAAKGGVVALTRSMANQYAGNGVRVNAIAPGMTLTPRLQGRYEHSSAMQAYGSRHLMGLCTPEDMAQMAVFLASEESTRITGQVLQVDSGVTIH